MEYMTPNFTKDMVKTHKILIPNMAVTQFRLLQAALECEGYNVEVLGNCGSEVAQLGLKYVHNDTCYPALLVIGQFIDALNSGKMGAAGLDVVYTEPIKADNPLLQAKNCILTPHISWAPKESRQRIMDITVDNVKAFLNGAPQNVVNK